MTAAEIISFRQQYGFSQYELADAVALSRGFVSSVEQGLRGATGEVAQRFADFFQFVRECDASGRLGKPFPPTSKGK